MELMVAVAIMGITMAIGVPGMQTIITSSRLTTSANDMVASLQMARSEAIKRIQNSGVSITGNDWVTFVSTSSNVIQRFSAAKGINLVVTGGNNDDTPTYRPDGRLDANVPVTMTFTATANSTQQRILTISPSGRVSVVALP